MVFQGDSVGNLGVIDLSLSGRSLVSREDRRFVLFFTALIFLVLRRHCLAHS